MLYILAVIIILYISSYFLFKKNPTYIAVRKYVDITTIIVSTMLVITWVEVFNYSFFFIIYFLLSLSLIAYLFSKLKKIEIKKEKAQDLIKELKTEEKILENEIQRINKDVK